MTSEANQKSTMTFEDYAKSEHMDLSHPPRSDGYYSTTDNCQKAWKAGWQARDALAQREIAALTAEIKWLRTGIEILEGVKDEEPEP